MSTTTASTDGASASIKSKLLAAAAAIGLFVAGFVVLNLPSIPLLFVYGLEWVQSPTGLIASTAAGQVVLGLAVIGYVRWRGIPVVAGTPSRDKSLLIVAAVAVSVVAAIGLSYAREQVTTSESPSLLGEAIAAQPTLALVMALLSIVVIAPAEELLFRGAIQGRLRESFGPWAAIVGASLLFGSLHLLNFSGSVVGAILGAAVVGTVSLLWGYTRERTGNIGVPILIHGLYNATLMGIAYVQLV